jgi:hypothetical protein
MRVVVGLAPGHEPTAVADRLVAKGAHHVQGPTPSLPDVLVADFPQGDVDSTVKSIAELPGVRYAEPDEMRSILE